MKEVKNKRFLPRHWSIYALLHTVNKFAQQRSTETNKQKNSFSAVVNHTCYCSVTKSRLTLLRPYGLQHARLLCPWDFTGKNIGVGAISFFRGSS